MIDRIVQIARAGSSSTSVVVLVAFNLLPLVGVIFWGWNVATILVLYWAENGIVGLLNVPKMLLAGAPDGTGGEVRTNGVIAAARAGMVGFFLVHYGIFWFVHGIFVFMLPLFLGLSTTAVSPMPPAANGPDLGAVGWGALGLAISHGVSFVVNFLGRKEYLRTTIERQMFAPYGRLVILHVTILIGAFVSLAIGSPIGALIVLVILKTVLDLAFHLREHGRLHGVPQVA